MDILATINENWFTLLQSVGIIGSLLLGVVSLQDNARAQRAETIIKITAQHRQLWSDYHQNPQLIRVRQQDPDLESLPISDPERRFVQSVILHLNAVFHASRLGSLIEPEGVRKDIKAFFSLPIPSAVLRDHTHLLDKAFVRYLEDAIGRDG